MLFPVFKTQRLRLLQLSEDDIEGVFSLFSDERVIKYYDLAAFTQIGEAANLIAFFNTRFEEGSGIRWAIHTEESQQFIGTCGFNSWNPKMKNAVVGYDLMPEFWGQGYAREAVDRVIRAAFTGELSCGALNRIQGDTVPGNTASEALLKKVGFKEEGVRRQSGYWKNQFHDLKCFGLIKSEYSDLEL